MQGFIKFPKELFESPVYKNPFDFKLFMLVLGHCNFNESYEFEGVTLKKGEWIRSLATLQKDLSYTFNRQEIKPTKKEIRCSIERITRAGFFSFRGMDKGILFTLDESMIHKVFGHTEIVTRAETRNENSQNWGNKRRISLKNNNIKNNKKNYITQTVVSNRVYPNFGEVFYKCYNRYPSAITIQDLNEYLTTEGIEEDMLCYCFEVATKNSKHINYMLAILNGWIAKGIKTYKAAYDENTKQRGVTSEPREDRYKDIDFGW